MLHHLLPYPSGCVAAHHNRAGIGPTLVASDRHRSGTGPPQVHRIRAPVCMYYTTIQICKYKIIQKIFKWRWGSDSPSGTAARNKSARPHSRAPRRVLIWENRKCDPATAVSYRAIRAATIATSSDPNGVVQVTENAPTFIGHSKCTSHCYWLRWQI